MPREIVVKSILNKKKARDSWFLDDYTLNLYSSCVYNCLYCYIRGSKYGQNLAETISVKTNALEILEKQLHLRAQKQQFGFIVLSSATDPYQDIDKKHQLTRDALALILKYKFPVHIITKSDLIARDFDLLQQIDATAIIPADLKSKLYRGTIISFSFSTLDAAVGKIFEPGAPSPDQRLQMLQQTSKTGLFTGVSLMPLLPFISDSSAQLVNYYKTFKQAGAHYIMPSSITLFGNEKADSKTLVLQAVEKHYPELLTKYLRYFEKNDAPPTAYQKAFDEIMLAFSQEFDVPQSILAASSKL